MRLDAPQSADEKEKSKLGIPVDSRRRFCMRKPMLLGARRHVLLHRVLVPPQRA